MLFNGGGTISNSGNEKTVIDNSLHGVTLQYGAHFIDDNPNQKLADTLYDYISISFTDKNGKPQKPFERMYIITKEFFNKSSLPEAHQHEYDSVIAYLKKRKLL